jgi:hypothetical protein
MKFILAAMSTVALSRLPSASLIIALLGIAPTASANAQAIPLVHFAGLALAGDAAKNDILFPYTQTLMQNQSKDAVLHFNTALVAQINAQTFDNIAITTADGDYRKGDGLALALVLTWENVRQEKFEDFTKIAVNLQAQALLFDFSTKQIVAAYPIGVEYIDKVTGEPDKQRILNDVKTLYDDKAGLFQAFATALHQIRPKTSFGARIQVVSADIAPAAAAVLAQNAIDLDQAKDLLANTFERYLSRNGNVPVLPHANNQTIGGVMAVHFVNGDTSELVIPPSDFQVHLTLNNLRKVEIGKTGAVTDLAYASYLDVSVVQPLSGTHYDGSFKDAAILRIANSGTPDDASEYQESLLTIADQVTQQFKAPSRDWMKQFVVQQSQIDQLEKIPAVLDRCR